ncbi:hypothetical protein GGX14DRAFT_412519 [Mycena pura]|uniref:Btz domain-containing protein n=1 Tax=Mycena pura TaxID=153505 RepID=A0AAD6YS64_9AGAR|nr:hypothetical protein GGX14DRAFT_412519 [Mycena pura]
MPSKRLAPRRGRAPHASESDDDDAERVARSDTDDSNDSLDESDSDSDSEPVSRHQSPNTSHSPDADEKPAPFFTATPAAWSDMMEDTADLPVISFDKLDAHTVRKVRMADPVLDSDEEDNDQPVASTSRHSPAPPFPRASRPQSQSARQAYQHRLESDPSFVPVVGEFWGHDDRLLDKDLRSLSGWWRGRWQGRGRARGGPFSRGRGRGAFSNGTTNGGDPEVAPNSPLDRTWTHDGFEEMRRREDNRHRPPVPRGGVPLRGSPSFRSRGALANRTPGRIWFAMKPELMWTKQHEAFLFFDPALKSRPGQPPGLRVCLPGGTSTVVRLVPRPRTVKPAQKTAAGQAEFVVHLPRGNKAQLEEEAPPADPPITVKLGPTVHPAPAPTPPLAPAPALAGLLEPDEDGWVQPDPATIALATVSSPPSGLPPALPSQPQVQSLPVQPPTFFPFAPPPSFGFPPPLYAPVAPPSTFPAPQPGYAQPPSFATHTPPPGFSTQTPPPPVFGTPPGFSAPLPLGVAMDARGMTYELASGRPVMLYGGYHTSSASVGGHAHPMNVSGPSHVHSMSVGGHAHTPSLSGQDPPLFAFARPSTRVEIRAPDGTRHSPTTSLLSPLSPRSPTRRSPLSREPDDAAHTAKKLRTDASAFVPSHAATPSTSGYLPASYDAGTGAHPNGATYDANGMYDAYGAYVPSQYYYSNPYYAQPNGETPLGTVYYG